MTEDRTDNDSERAEPADIVYITDLTFSRFDPADLYDLAFLLRSPRHTLRGVCLTEPDSDAERVIDALATAAGASLPTYRGVDDLVSALSLAPAPLNLVVTGGYTVTAALVDRHRSLVREKVARLFLIGGHVNDYSMGRAGERFPIDPRLKERHPERFASEGDPRFLFLPSARESYAPAFGRLLASGEGIIWLPRDLCLWRYAAPQLLTDGGSLCEFLLRETFWAHLFRPDGPRDRYDAAEEPVLLSALPALLLATQPDPFAWMRLFRVTPALVAVAATGAVQRIDTRTESPNLYVVIAIDGQALGKVLTQTVRIRPLNG